MQAAENAYLTEGKPMQSRWDAVTRQCRAEILRRISVAQHPETNAPSNVEEAGDGVGVDDDIDTEEFDEDGVACISVREALRDIEDALTRPLSNEALFDLYMLITEVCRHESGKVFEELEPPIIDMMMTRIEAGSPDPEPDGGPTWFDFPERGEEALKALVERQLPHKTLLMLYCLGWYEYDHRDLWLAISDLAKAQILRRMAPPYGAWEGNWEDRARSELLRRLRLHRHDGSTIPTP